MKPTAHDILQAAGKHMQDRSATFDKPQGERSIPATVQAFNAVTGHQLTAEQGWIFVMLLKAVRSQQGDFLVDSYEAGAAYFALAGEQAAADRQVETRFPTHQETEAGEHTDWDAAESRMDVVGSNGNNGEHYPDADGWIENTGVMPVEKGALVDVRHRDGDIFYSEPAGDVGSAAEIWSHSPCGGYITHYRLSK